MMKRNTIRSVALAGSALMLATGLAACGDREPESAPIDNAAFDEDLPPPAADMEPMPEPEASPMENAALDEGEALPPPLPVQPDAQVMDDAAATGMTSRSTRGEADANDDEPADPPVLNEAIY